MGRIVSPAGDVIFEMKSLKHHGDNLVIVGKMGVWESEVYLSYKEMLGFFLRRDVLLALIMLPMLLVRALFRRGKK